MTQLRFELNINDLLEWNRRLVRVLNEMARQTADGKLQKIAVEVAIKGAELARPLTPVVTGSWASSWAAFPDQVGAVIAISPQAINPLSPERPYQYGPKVHEMGGISRSGHRRNVLDVLIAEHGEEMLDDLEAGFMGALEVF